MKEINNYLENNPITFNSEERIAYDTVFLLGMGCLAGWFGFVIGTLSDVQIILGEFATFQAGCVVSFSMLAFCLEAVAFLAATLVIFGIAYLLVPSDPVQTHIIKGFGIDKSSDTSKNNGTFRFDYDGCDDIDAGLRCRVYCKNPKTGETSCELLSADCHKVADKTYTIPKDMYVYKFIFYCGHPTFKGGADFDPNEIKTAYHDSYSVALAKNAISHLPETLSLYAEKYGKNAYRLAPIHIKNEINEKDFIETFRKAYYITVLSFINSLPIMKDNNKLANFTVREYVVKDEFDWTTASSQEEYVDYWKKNSILWKYKNKGLSDYNKVIKMEPDTILNLAKEINGQ